MRERCSAPNESTCGLLHRARPPREGAARPNHQPAKNHDHDHGTEEVVHRHGAQGDLSRETALAPTLPSASRSSMLSPGGHTRPPSCSRLILLRCFGTALRAPRPGSVLGAAAVGRHRTRHERMARLADQIPPPARRRSGTVAVGVWLLVLTRARARASPTSPALGIARSCPASNFGRVGARPIFARRASDRASAAARAALRCSCACPHGRRRLILD